MEQWRRQNMLLVLALLLFPPSLCWGAAQPGFVTDSDMGIHTYTLPVEISDQPSVVRLHLRFLCNPEPAHVAVHGFAGVFPFSNSPPLATRTRPHYTAAAPAGVRPNCSITNRLDGSAVPLQWSSGVQFGFWRFKASISSKGLHYLGCCSAGGGWQQPLPWQLCSAAGDSQQQQLPRGGVWNVITTTSSDVSQPYVKTMAFLLLEHHSYLRRLGFNGTLLRGNAAETQQLLKLDSIRQAVDKDQLLLWPWDQEHSAGAAPHYWQQPKNQLTLLGLYGRGLRLAFFDLDEYLVLPAGGSIHSARCGGQPLLDDAHDAWELDRYQAKSCKGSSADIDCWRSGQPLPRVSQQAYWQELCPMGDGKPLFVADMAESMAVHETFRDVSAGAKGSRRLPRSCAFLLHFFALMSGRREEVAKRVLSKPAATWSLDEQGRGVIGAAEGLNLDATDAECEAYWARTLGGGGGKKKGGKKGGKVGRHQLQTTAGDVVHRK